MPPKVLGASPQRTDTPAYRDLPSHLHMVGFTNVRGVRGKIAELYDFCQAHQLDVMAIYETWLNSEIRDSEVAIPGMTIYHTVRVGRFGEVQLCMLVILCITYQHETLCSTLLLNHPGL